MKTYGRHYKGEFYVLLMLGNGKKCFLFILEDGGLRRVNGTFTSPSAAAQAVNNWPTCDGPRFWVMK